MTGQVAHGANSHAADIRHNWARPEVEALISQPLNDLLFEAQSLHRQFFDPNAVQVSTLLSIKTGGCAEDCAYCSQSAHHETGLTAEKLMEVKKVLDEAQKAKKAGATRYCMGAAWREPKDRDMDAIALMIEGVKAMGMETCMTLGMLSVEQTLKLKDAGLDYYNHNIDTSPEFYDKIITTRTFQDRLDTLSKVREAGIKICSGGIVGLGEDKTDRAGMLMTLANLNVHPESVPINMLIRVAGTPLSKVGALDPIDFVRTIAAARIMMPMSMVRLSAGRQEMTDELQAMCFFAGANSIFLGDKLLTADNAEPGRDEKLFKTLGIRPMTLSPSPSGANAAQ
jgi:biotin synthase